MIDNSVYRILFYDNYEWNQLLNRVQGCFIKGKESKSYIDFHNLRIEYYPLSQELWIRNSLHVFRNAAVREFPIGNFNHDDFGIKELQEVGNYFIALFDRPLCDFNVIGKFEYGVNIDVTPYEIRKIVSSYQSIGSTRINQFEPIIPRKGKVIGKCCYQSEYKVKFYDKSTQAQLVQKGILRYEIVNDGVGRLKKLLNQSNVTLQDLMEKQNLKVLGRNLIETYDRIRKFPINSYEIPRKDMLDILAYSNPVMIDYDKRTMSSWEFSKQNQNSKIIMKEYNEKANSVHSWLRMKLVNKVDQLLN